MASIKALIENPHPIYNQYISFWNFLMQSYEGGIDYTNSDIVKSVTNHNSIIDVKVNGKPLKDRRHGNLFKHKKERSEDYIERVDMSYFYNFCAPIIDIYTNHLFKGSVNSDWKSIQDIIEMRIDNIDRKGSSIIEFRKEIAELSQIYGHVFVLVDKPKTESEIFSLANQLEQGIFPYLNIFHPQDVINWALDEFGQPYWVLLRENINSNIDPFNFDKNKMMVSRYRIWTRKEWILFNEDYEEIERGNHQLGKVPLAIVYNKPSKKNKNFMGISEIADISFIARDVYNKCSELNEIIRNQTFAVLCLQGKSTEYDELSVGTSKALLYPPERNVPQYISPASENAKILMDQIDRQVHKIFQIAKLDGGSAQQSEQVTSQSGISKAFDFQETNSALAKKAGHMEDAEMRIWEYFARWENKEFDGHVSYPRDFNIQGINEDIEQAEGLMRLSLGREVNIQMKKEIIKKKFPRISEDDMQKMVVEMESKEGQSEGNSIRSRLPNLFNNSLQNNGIPAGQNGRVDNGRR